MEKFAIFRRLIKIGKGFKLLSKPLRIIKILEWEGKKKTG